MADVLQVQGSRVAIVSRDQKDYISLTDIAKHRNPDTPADIVKNWLRSRSTIEFLGLWEQLNNPDFKLVEFDQFKSEAGANYFVLSPQKWIESTAATPANALSLDQIRRLNRAIKFTLRKAIRHRGVTEGMALGAVR